MSSGPICPLLRGMDIGFSLLASQPSHMTFPKGIAMQNADLPSPLGGTIPTCQFGAGTPSLFVLNGGQAFMRRPSRGRLEREARRMARLLPPNRSFVLLGYRQSPPEAAGLDAIADDLAHALRDRGTPVALVAISYGGPVALRIASRHPGLISDLVLVASAHSFSRQGLERMQKQLAYARGGKFPELIAEFAALFRRPWFNWLLKLRLLAQRRSLARDMNRPELIAAYLEAGLTADGSRGWDWLRRVQARTLIVGGAEDQFFGAERMQETALAITGAELVMLPGETHMAPLERTTAFREAIGRFLSAKGSMCSLPEHTKQETKMNTDIEIRRATSSDRSHLHDLFQRSWMTTWAPECPEEVVAEFRESDLVGQYLNACLEQIDIGMAEGRLVAAMHLDGDHLAALHVDPELKGQGIGSAMMDLAELRGAARLEVRAFNDAAIRFYEKRGWRRTRTYTSLEMSVPMTTHEYQR